MSSHAGAIKNAQELIRDRIMDKLRANPKAYGKVAVEVTIQDGKITTVTATSTETVKPE